MMVAIKQPLSKNGKTPRRRANSQPWSRWRIYIGAVLAADPTLRGPLNGINEPQKPGMSLLR
jgi:hypothetical protein